MNRTPIRSAQPCFRVIDAASGQVLCRQFATDAADASRKGRTFLAKAGRPVPERPRVEECEPQRREVGL